MKHHSIFSLVLIIGLGSLLLAGCGAMSGNANGSSGYGADGGPWPTQPTRNNANPQPVARPSDQPPTVPITFSLRGKVVEKQELRLTLAQIQLRYGTGDRWYTVAGQEELAKSGVLPLRITAKDASLLVVRASVPLRKYTYLRLKFNDEKCVLVREEKPDAAVQIGEVSMALNDWTPADNKTNQYQIKLDGAKLAIADKVTLPAAAFSARGFNPAGGISGTVSPALPTARVDIYWGGTTVLFGSAAPAAQDGSFTLANLPAGQYRVEVNATGLHLEEPLKDPVVVDDKVVALKPLKLTAQPADGGKKDGK